MAKHVHKLWSTGEWEQASLEEVISALFNTPPFPDPIAMGSLQRHHPTAVSQYQNLFYGGNIPSYAQRPSKRR